MSSSVRELILEAIKAALVAAGGPAGLVVKRFATYAADPAALPMVKFYWVSDVAEIMPPRGSAPLDKHALLVRFECYTTGTNADGSESDAAVDALLIWLEQQLFVDQRFGGLSTFVLPVKADTAAVSEDRTYIRIDADYEVHYTTRRGDLTTRA